ncbi:hypothetical protein HYALB_00008613 [Hymenoscyphus albidus]|uniref:Uncharacterized protein n=1 Tax=Hymenoscyphus albidus TaxID=595503 RepID=A0A9N9L9P6_9HELO|nr:hypothetical protein HYALB_00008613 [Hymenoscyphus albidus]
MYIIAGLMMNRWGFERLKRHGSVHLQMRVNDRAISTMVGIWTAASRSLRQLGQCSNAHKTLGQNDCCSCRMYLQWSKNRADAAKTTVQKHLDPRYWKHMTFPPSPEELEAAEMVLSNYCQDCIKHGELKEAMSVLQHAVHKLPNSVQLQLMLADVRSRAPKSDRKAKRRAAKAKRTVPKEICSKAEGPQPEEYFTADLFCVTPITRSTN